MIRIRLTTLLLLLLLLIGACTRASPASPKDAILGEWHQYIGDTPGGYGYHFSEANAVTVTGGASPIPGTYEWVSDTEIHINVPALGESFDETYRVAIAGDQMTLTDPLGLVGTFRRVPTE